MAFLQDLSHISRGRGAGRLRRIVVWRAGVSWCCAWRGCGRAPSPRQPYSCERPSSRAVWRARDAAQARKRCRKGGWRDVDATRGEVWLEQEHKSQRTDAFAPRARAPIGPSPRRRRPSPVRARRLGSSDMEPPALHHPPPTTRSPTRPQRRWPSDHAPLAQVKMQVNDGAPGLLSSPPCFACSRLASASSIGHAEPHAAGGRPWPAALPRRPTSPLRTLSRREIAALCRGAGGAARAITRRSPPGPPACSFAQSQLAPRPARQPIAERSAAAALTSQRSDSVPQDARDERRSWRATSPCSRLPVRKKRFFRVGAMPRAARSPRRAAAFHSTCRCAAVDRPPPARRTTPLLPDSCSRLRYHVLHVRYAIR